MERTFSPSLSLISLLCLLLVEGVLNWLIRIQTSYSNLQQFLQTQLDFDELVRKSKVVRTDNKKILSSSDDLSSRQLISHHDEIEEDGKLLIGDVEIVMKNLGIFCNPVDVHKFHNDHIILGSDEFSSLFDEDEPSLAEVKEAFNVFDQNKDGFIDARELQRILCSLGFREGSDLKECERMIRVFDENADGRIDFNEFVKFMENCFW
ncbi:EF-hand domain [Macleaya cordata]|uniref:EF-hand domain n=1 Tax=Macleaya cordata TaxID=56857 RepID=A0A200QEW5_MACCD|nr:EF-hand domain [Macleaya cordata]